MTDKTNKNLARAATMVILLNLSSCGNYEDNPAFSLRLEKGRLVGEWEVVEIDGQNTQGTFGSFVDAEYQFEFENDGDASFSVQGTYVYSYGYYSTPVDLTIPGEWEHKKRKH